MKTSRIQKGKAGKRQTEPNRTQKEEGANKVVRPRSKQEAASVPVKGKAEKTNNPPSKRKTESSDRRHEEGGRT